MAERRTLEAIKNQIGSHLGERVHVRAVEGRKRVLEIEGILEKTYPSIFLVRLPDTEGRYMTWSYIDVLTDSVTIEFGRSESAEAAEAG